MVTLAGKTTIGRDPTCSIFLPDPEKHISRLHATIEYRDGNYCLTVSSKTNPLVVNSKSYRHGQSIILGDGDRIVIRSYTLTTDFYPTRGESSQEIINDSIRPASPKSSAPSYFADKHDPFSLDDPIARHKADNDPDPFEILKQTSRDNELVEGIAPLPYDGYHDSLGKRNLDPITALSRQETINTPGIQGDTFRPPQISRFDDLLASLSPHSIENSNAANSNQTFVPLVDLGEHRPSGTKSLEHVHDINLPYTPPSLPEAADNPTTSVSAETSPAQAIDDLFATLNACIAPTSPVNLAQTPLQQNDSLISTADRNDSGSAPDHESACASRFPHPIPPSQAGNPHPIPLAENEQIESLINAFRNSAGLSSQPIRPEEAIAYMESVGAIMRTAIEGISSLLASRSMLKGELGAEDRTIVASRDNNPLKLMPDIQDVMQFLFERKNLNSQAYLTPVQSIAGACKDLIYHELGTVAGIRAAVEGAILHFNPQLIEAELDQAGRKTILFRKAALWETYVENYRRISMTDDIGKIFERDFRRAYDDQIRKLKKSDPTAPR